MPTSLGGGMHQSLRYMVKNGTAATLERGTIVTWFSVAASNPAVAFLDLANGKQDFVAGGGVAPNIEQMVPYITVKASIADAATPGTTAPLGVLATDVLAGGFGEMVVHGITRVRNGSGGTIAAGIVVTCDGSGLMIDAAAASHDNPFGITLESSDDPELAHCWVNFIGIAAGASAAGAHGKAY